MGVDVIASAFGVQVNRDATAQHLLSYLSSLSFEVAESGASVNNSTGGSHFTNFVSHKLSRLFEAPKFEAFDVDSIWLDVEEAELLVLPSTEEQDMTKSPMNTAAAFANQILKEKEVERAQDKMEEEKLLQAEQERQDEIYQRKEEEQEKVRLEKMQQKEQQKEQQQERQQQTDEDSDDYDDDYSEDWSGSDVAEEELCTDENEILVGEEAVFSLDFPDDEAGPSYQAWRLVREIADPPPLRKQRDDTTLVQLLEAYDSLDLLTMVSLERRLLRKQRDRARHRSPKAKSPRSTTAPATPAGLPRAPRRSPNGTGKKSPYGRSPGRSPGGGDKARSPGGCDKAGSQGKQVVASLSGVNIKEMELRMERAKHVSENQTNSLFSLLESDALKRGSEELEDDDSYDADFEEWAMEGKAQGRLLADAFLSEEEVLSEDFEEFEESEDEFDESVYVDTRTEEEKRLTLEKENMAEEIRKWQESRDNMSFGPVPGLDDDPESVSDADRLSPLHESDFDSTDSSVDSSDDVSESAPRSAEQKSLDEELRKFENGKKQARRMRKEQQRRFQQKQKEDAGLKAFMMSGL